MLRQRLFIITTLLVFPLPQLAIDLYLPSLPAMAVDLQTSHFLLQLTLTVYILSLGITQLIYGPCSDRFGRKPVLLFGTFIFFLGSIACIFAQSITQLILFRIIQGLGMGCGFTVASAIIGDSFKGKELARMSTFESIVYSTSPIFAPVLGGYIQHWYGWRYNFVFIVLCTFLLLMAIVFFIQESNKNLHAKALHPATLVRDYISVFTSIKFIGYILSMALAFGTMVTFNVVGPFLLQTVLHVSAVHYGQLLFLVGVAYLLGTFINSHALKNHSVNGLIVFGFIIMNLSSIALLVSGCLGWFSPLSVILFTCAVIFASGFVFPNAFAKALEIFPEKLGVASAVVGASGLLITSLISVIVAHVYNSNEIALAIMFLIQSLLIVCFFLLARKFS